jgi:hypothetical protein
MYSWTPDSMLSDDLKIFIKTSSTSWTLRPKGSGMTKLENTSKTQMPTDGEVTETALEKILLKAL